MFVERLWASDPRFKRLTFGTGLNILLAERSADSAQGDSRNSVGKTSFVLVLRYLLGSGLPDDLKTPELESHIFADSSTSPRGAGLLSNRYQ